MFRGGLNRERKAKGIHQGGKKNPGKEELETGKG